MKLTPIKLVYIIGGILGIWLIASYIDVVAHNLTTYTYQPWNLFEILF